MAEVLVELSAAVSNYIIKKAQPILDDEGDSLFQAVLWARNRLSIPHNRSRHTCIGSRDGAYPNGEAASSDDLARQAPITLKFKTFAHDSRLLGYNPPFVLKAYEYRRIIWRTLIIGDPLQCKLLAVR